MGRRKKVRVKNELGVSYLAVFRLRFYGLNVFLVVSSLGPDFVRVYEVENCVRDEEWEGIQYDYTNQDYVGKEPQDRLIVGPEYANIFDSVGMKLKTVLDHDEPCLAIPVVRGSRLLKAVENNPLGVVVEPGVYLARMVCDGEYKSKEKLLRMKFRYSIPHPVNKRYA